jgi:hypothetical protein
MSVRFVELSIPAFAAGSALAPESLPIARTIGSRQISQKYCCLPIAWFFVDVFDGRKAFSLQTGRSRGALR